MVEPPAHNRLVVGSNPTGPTNTLQLQTKSKAVAYAAAFFVLCLLRYEDCFQAFDDFAKLAFLDAGIVDNERDAVAARFSVAVIGVERELQAGGCGGAAYLLFAQRCFDMQQKVRAGVTLDDAGALRER